MGQRRPVSTVRAASTIGSLKWHLLLGSLRGTTGQRIQSVLAIVVSAFIGVVACSALWGLGVSSRDGIVEERISTPGGISAVTGKVPLSDMFQYSTRLRSMTQGRGTYSMEPASYEPVPPNIAEKVLAEYAKG